MKKLELPASLSAKFLIAFLCISPAAMAQTLALRHGVYVLKSSPCDTAPNAAIMVWGTTGFSSAHSSGCNSQVKHLPNNTYSVNTVCTALGDGTPDPAGANEVDKLILTRLSATEYSVLKPAGTELSYRWCSAK